MAVAGKATFWDSTSAAYTGEDPVTGADETVGFVYVVNWDTCSLVSSFGYKSLSSSYFQSIIIDPES